MYFNEKCFSVIMKQECALIVKLLIIFSLLTNKKLDKWEGLSVVILSGLFC